MNEIVNNFLLAGSKSMPEMHLKQPGFTFSACGLFSKTRKRIKKFKENRYKIYLQNELDKAYFQHDHPCPQKTFRFIKNEHIGVTK